MKLSDFKVDVTKQNDGVVKNFDADGKVYIRVAREGNERYQKKCQR